MRVHEDLSASQDNLFVYWTIFITAFMKAVNWTSPQQLLSAAHMSEEYTSIPVYQYTSKFKNHFIYFASSDLIL
jgi:hypothetical protein